MDELIEFLKENNATIEASLSNAIRFPPAQPVAVEERFNWNRVEAALKAIVELSGDERGVHAAQESQTEGNLQWV